MLVVEILIPRQPLISNYGNGLTPSAMKKAAQNPRAGYPNSVFNGRPYWDPHVASQQFLANTIKQNRQFKLYEKKLYHKKTKYDKKTGEWIFQPSQVKWILRLVGQIMRENYYRRGGYCRYNKIL